MAETDKPASVFDWKYLLAKHGFNAVLVMLLMGFIRQDMILPQRQAQERFMESVIENNKEMATTAASNSATAQTQARSLEQLVDLQKQIRDDQRQGVWREREKANP